MITVTTVGDEVFELDYHAKTWKRTANPRNIGNLRTPGGEFLEADNPEIGQRLSLVCAPIVENASARLIILDPIKKVEVS